MNESLQKGLSWKQVLFGLLVAIVLVIILIPVYLRSVYQGGITTAGSNTKAIAGALNLFKQEYGSYPDQRTRKLLVRDGNYDLSESDDANAYLAQLIVSGFAESETEFFVPGVEGFVEGDDEKSAGRLLAKGENGFAYIMTEGGGSLAGQHSLTPLVITPATQGGQTPLFDPEPFDGKYVYGAVDGSSKLGEIGEGGIAKSKGRSSLFETGRNSLFGLEIPVVKMPLRD